VTKGIEIEIVSTAAEAAGAAQRVAFGVNANGFVPFNKLTLDPVAFLAVSCPLMLSSILLLYDQRIEHGSGQRCRAAVLVE
jgi:hypothetical protein